MSGTDSGLRELLWLLKWRSRSADVAEELGMNDKAKVEKVALCGQICRGVWIAESYSTLLGVLGWKAEMIMRHYAATNATLLQSFWFELFVIFCVFHVACTFRGHYVTLNAGQGSWRSDAESQRKMPARQVSVGLLLQSGTSCELMLITFVLAVPCFTSLQICKMAIVGLKNHNEDKKNNLKTGAKCAKVKGSKR